MAEPPKTRGRPRSFPVEDVIKELITRKEQIIVDGNVVGKKNGIWQDISSALNKKSDGKINMSATYLYVSVKGNRVNLLDNLLENQKEELKQNEDLRTPESGSDNGPSSQESSANSSSSPDDSSGEDSAKGTLRFKIKFSPNEWNQIKPENVTYSDKTGCGRKRTYQTLKRNTWTHAINEKFWCKTKLNCKLAYYGGRVATSDVVHKITINGKCCHCKAKLYTYLEKLPGEGEPAEFYCSYEGNFSTEHPKGLKRNLAGVVRKRAVDKLLRENVAPLALQLSQADELMVFGDDEPAHLPTTKQLRDAKSSEAKRRRVDENPIVAIAKAMHTSRFQNIIRDVAYDKFQVRYHSAAQLHVYKSYCKQNHPVSVALDATGGVVKKLQRAPGVKSGPIFLYSIVVRDSSTNKIYPVSSLLSERHDTETLRHWLSNFLRGNVPLPAEVVTDMSSALMSASVQAFTSCPSLEAYIKKCAQLLSLTETPSDSTRPECYIRNDVAHLVKLMTTWECFKRCIKITKQFYMRCLCQVLQSTDLEDIKTLLTHIMTVATCETEGQDIKGQPTPCEISKNMLISRIGGLLPVSSDVMTYKEEDCDDPATQLLSQEETAQRRKKTMYEENPFYIMAKEIKEVVDKRKVDGDRGNQQYLPGLVKHILGISMLIPLWTSVMVPIFGFGGVTASSAAVEADFNILKNIIFKNKTLPMRVDDFIFHHIPSIEGAMKIAAAQKKDNDDTEFHSVLENDSTIHTIERNNDKESSDTRLQDRMREAKHKEDWGGLVQTKQSTIHRRHQSYLQLNPEMTLSDLTKTRPRLPLGLIKNGNTDLLQPVKLRSGLKVTLTNTCAYDSILQVFAVAFCDSVNFQSTIESSSNPFFGRVKDFVLKGVTKTTYVDRAELLQPFVENVKLPQDVYMLKCETTLTALVPVLLGSEPSVFEVSICDQESCPDKQREKNRVPISISITAAELDQMQTYVQEEVNVKYSMCLQGLHSDGYCQGNRVLTKDLTNYILIEPVEKNDLKLLQCVLKVRDIPNKIFINNNEYFLRGCVGYVGSDNTSGMGHYIAYVLRCDGCWETYNDLRAKKEESATKGEIKCHLILYTV